MPPRSEEELDAVTLHNQALMNMEIRPTEGFEKLQFLLQQNPFPPETLGNLLLLYCKYEYYDLAADVLAENTHLTYKYLTPVSTSKAWLMLFVQDVHSNISSSNIRYNLYFHFVFKKIPALVTLLFTCF